MSALYFDRAYIPYKHISPKGNRVLRWFVFLQTYIPGGELAAGKCFDKIIWWLYILLFSGRRYMFAENGCQL